MTVQRKVHFTQARSGQKRMRVGTAAPIAPATVGRVPHLSRLMALAIKFDGMLQRGEVTDYAELARLGRVTRARVTQIMNLLNLAPDIQEALLFLAPVEKGRAELREWQVRPVAASPAWPTQLILWQRIGGSLSATAEQRTTNDNRGERTRLRNRRRQRQP